MVRAFAPSVLRTNLEGRASVAHDSQALLTGIKYKILAIRKYNDFCAGLCTESAIGIICNADDDLSIAILRVVAERLAHFHA
jgi:hypothetical protein